MKKIFYIIIAFVLFAVSCDKVEGPYIEKIENGNDTSEFVQNILIEDFTGHKCPNCPRAARTLEEIHHNFGDRIIPMALHVSTLADPSSGAFNLDLKTDEGSEIDDFFGVSTSPGLPNGMINRTVYNESLTIGDGDWTSATSLFLDKKPSLGIKIQSILDTINNVVSINVNTHVLKDTIENLMLCVYILENGIIGAQYDSENPAGGTLTYEFNHTLRASLNGTWGDEISTVNDTLKSGGIINKNYEKFPLKSDWVFQNLSVVVYIYDNDSKEIIQADNLRLFTSYIVNGN